MAKEYPNSGALFKNDNRKTDKHPEYTGSLNVDGTEYWINAWVKNGKKGPFFSLAVKPKDAGHVTSTTKRQEPRITASRQESDIGDDDIPF